MVEASLNTKMGNLKRFRFARPASASGDVGDPGDISGDPGDISGQGSPPLIEVAVL